MKTTIKITTPTKPVLILTDPIIDPIDPILEPIIEPVIEPIIDNIIQEPIPLKQPDENRNDSDHGQTEDIEQNIEESLHIHDESESFEEEETLYKKVGENLELNCAHAGKSAKQDIKWTKLNAENEPLQTISTLNSLQLIFTSLKIKDSGTYKCSLNKKEILVSLEVTGK